VLRALGLSGRQLLAFQVLVHGVIGIGAVLLGAWIGMRTHRIVITFLEHTEEGGAVLPPFAPQTDWSGVGLMLIVAVVAMAVVVGWLGWRFVKAPVWQALRQGDN
jgi:ABC-type antimicrobial peptide transport system permease subunit